MGFLHLLGEITFHYPTLGIGAGKGDLTTTVQLFLLLSCKQHYNINTAIRRAF